MTASPCQRWLFARLAFALSATLWVVLFDPSAVIPALLTLTLALGAALDRHRSRAWLDSHGFVLSALMLTMPSPFLAALGAAALPNTALALFAPGSTSRPSRLRPRLRALLVALATALALALLSTPATAYALALPLAVFLSTRPLAALGEVFRALGLYRGPVDPLLAWRPLAPPHGARA